MTSSQREPNSSAEQTTSDSDQESKVKAPPSYLKVTIANLVCPGYGAWISGEKIRGLVIFFVLMSFLVVYVNNVSGTIKTNTNKLRSAMIAGNQKKIETVYRDLANDLTKDSNLEIFFYGYILSIIDSLYLVYNRKNGSG
ncbi:MAG: hypothetical protein PHF29_07570 [Candidatus Riflebacteria bacterium]|nr:hypothetical protein [Candidatus Riflebacteria bacterium]